MISELSHIIVFDSLRADLKRACRRGYLFHKQTDDHPTGCKLKTTAAHIRVRELANIAVILTVIGINSREGRGEDYIK